MTDKEKKPPIQIAISRTGKPDSDLAAKIDEVSEMSGLPVRTVAVKSMAYGLPHVRRTLEKLNPPKK